MIDAATVNQIATILEREPRAREVVEAILNLEHNRCPDDPGCDDYSAAHLHNLHHGGFEWHQIGVAGHVLARLVNAGLLEVSYRSRSRTQYALRDPAAAAAALDLPPTATPVHAVGGESLPELPADLFDSVIGLEEEKSELRACLEATPPVSALISGPSASAKSVLVAEIARLGGACQLHGGAITAAGLTQLLLDPTPPRYLIVDEADKGRPVVLNRLLSVLETGLVTDLAYGRHRETRLTLWGIFVVNDPRRLDPALRSRLWPITLRPYPDEATRRLVIAGFLAMREGLDPELAQEIATLVAPHTSDVRRARDVARLCKGDRRRAAEFAARLAR